MARGDELLVLPYSSGTTGLPKGVLLSHKVFLSNNIQFNSSIRATDADPFLIFLPFYHIYGLMLMGGAVHGGVPMVVMERFDMAETLRLIVERRMTHRLRCPAGAAGHGQPARRSARSTGRRPDGHGRRGAACRPSWPAAVTAAHRREGRAGLRSHRGRAGDAPEPRRTTTTADDRHGGLPCNDTEQKIVDLETGERSCVGEVGEIIVRGPQVMLGYWNAPESTAAALRNGWLYTGDIAHDEPGLRDHHDRKKEMIKYKGFGIAPAEIEALLFEHPGVADCAVIGKPDTEAGEVPKAFVVRKDPALTRSVARLGARPAGRL